MNKNEFKFIIASPFDREKLICEIYYREAIIAEISQENNEFLLEIYPLEKNEWWSVPLLEFQKTLEDAKNHLLKEAA